MDKFTSRRRLLIIVGAILISGFITVNLANYYVSSNAIRSALTNNELPLTSNNIYSEIQVSLLRPVYISSLMANNTFLKDWILDGEKDSKKITKYLTKIRSCYDVTTAFMVSAKTRNYYHCERILKQVARSNPRDDWFFHMYSYKNNYKINVDNDAANHNHLTIFINHKVLDYNGNFIGVTGLGLGISSIAKMIDRYHQNYQCNIYFVDTNGLIKSHPQVSMIDRNNIKSLPGIKEVADKVLTGDHGFLTYKKYSDNILLSFRFIPELNWFLMVEQSENNSLKPIRNALYLNLLISLAITLTILLIGGFTVNRFQARLEALAKTDKLTGLINRHYFDVLFDNSLNNIDRHTQGLSLAIFDLDNFKTINDTKGHLVGDKILQKVATLALNNIRKSDIVARWGGDEFVILLLDCNIKTATRLLDKIRQSIISTLNDKENGISFSISAGIAEFTPGDTCDTLLARADEYLYKGKENGKNQVVNSLSA